MTILHSSTYALPVVVLALVCQAAVAPEPGGARHLTPMANALGMWFIYIDSAKQSPEGFWMGSSCNERGRGKYEHRHRVKLTNGYWIGRTEITQAQWKEVMGDNPSFFDADDQVPVGRVSWDDCQEFCRKLSEKCGGTYRLPTEAEWEYACRAGTTEPYAGTGRLDEMSWSSNNSNGEPHPVACKSANAWRLHDMHGNVSEWCQDWYGEAYYMNQAAGVDPTGPKTGKNRVMRGGSYYFAGNRSRSATRGSGMPDVKADNVGLRVVYEPDRLVQGAAIELHARMD